MFTLQFDNTFLDLGASRSQLALNLEPLLDRSLQRSAGSSKNSKIINKVGRQSLKDKAKKMDLDSTAALLRSNLPVGGDPNSVKKKKKSPPKPYEDSDEDEIFFGAEKSEKEKNGKHSK